MDAGIFCATSLTGETYEHSPEEEPKECPLTLGIVSIVSYANSNLVNIINTHLSRNIF